MRAASAQRQHRAAVAATLLHPGRAAAHAVDWDSLTHAPAWLALPHDALEQLALRVGTVMLAPSLRLWIAVPAVKAAQTAMGRDWWAALMSHEAWPEVNGDVPQALGLREQQLPAADLAQLFRSAGTAVLASTLPHGSLRHAVSEALAPVGAFVMPQAQALALVALAERLGARA